MHPCVSARRASVEVYRLEPCIACQFICGPESDWRGEGSHSWATGTAAWTLIVAWEWMLGVRPELEGLRIDACLPLGQTRAKMTRTYRGATYEIEIEKPEGICKGRAKVILDGEELAGDVIPPQGDGGSTM